MYFYFLKLNNYLSKAFPGGKDVEVFWEFEAISFPVGSLFELTGLSDSLLAISEVTVTISIGLISSCSSSSLSSSDPSVTEPISPWSSISSSLQVSDDSEER